MGVSQSGTLVVSAEDAINGSVGTNQQSYIIDQTPATVAITAPTKLDNIPFVDTAIQIIDETKVDSGSISISGASTASAT